MNFQGDTIQSTKQGEGYLSFFPTLHLTSEDELAWISLSKLPHQLSPTPPHLLGGPIHPIPTLLSVFLQLPLLQFPAAQAWGRTAEPGPSIA